MGRVGHMKFSVLGISVDITRADIAGVVLLGGAFLLAVLVLGGRKP